MTARFWVFVNDGWVRLTLAQGQSRSWFYGGANEEGYSWDDYTWRFDDDTVVQRWEQRSRDCDGRYDHSSYEECRLDFLTSVGSTPRITRTTAMILQDMRDGNGNTGRVMDDWRPARPDWQELDKTFRDHTAEAAGY